MLGPKWTDYVSLMKKILLGAMNIYDQSLAT